MATVVPERELLRSMSRNMTLSDVEALLKAKQSRTDTEDSDDDEDQAHAFQWTDIYARIPGLKTFLSLPAFPTSNVPASLDCGMTKARNTIFLIFSEPDSKIGVITFLVVMLAIALSIGAFCVSTLTEYRIRSELGITGTSEQTFETIEKICISIFTAEYLSRLFTVTAVPSERELSYIERRGWNAHGSKPCPLAWPATLPQAWLMVKTSAWKLVKFVLAPLNLIDGVAIAPFYYNLVYPSDVSGNLMIIRVLRLARVFRLARMSKRMEGVQILASTMITAMDALGFLAFFLSLAVIMFGTIIFFCEGGDYDPSTGQFMRPNVLGNGMEPSPFKSIPHSFWWTIVTMTTVGYGDFVPTTDAGRTLGSLIMLCGVMVLALPITVVGSAFTEEYAKYKERRLLELIEAREQAEEELSSQQAQLAAEQAATAERAGAASSGELAGKDKDRGDHKGGAHDRPASTGSDDPAPTHKTTDDAARKATSSVATASGAAAHGDAGSSPERHAVVHVSSVSSPALSSVSSAPNTSQTELPRAVSMLDRLRGSMGISFVNRSKRGSVSGSGGISSPPLRASADDIHIPPPYTAHAHGQRTASKDRLPSSSQRELDLLVAMRRGRARLQAVSALETAFKAGTVPITAEAVYNGRLGAGAGGISIASPLGIAAGNSAAIAEVADALSQQMRDQHKDASEATAAYKGEVSSLKTVVLAQAQSMERMRDEMYELKQAMAAILQAVQMQSGLQAPGSTGVL